MRPLLPLATALLIACSGSDEEPIPGDPCEESGNICTFIGVPGEALYSPEGIDRLETRLFLPQDITFADDGTAYYPDFNNHRVRRINLDGTVDTISGTGMLGDGPNNSGSTNSCWDGCDSLLSAWNHPTHVAVNPAAPNEIWVAAWHNSRINLIDTDANTLTWYAGTGGRYYAPGDASVAILDLPSALAFGPDGDIYFSDQANHLIRKVTAAGEVVDIAGQPRQPGMSGDGGLAVDAQLHGHTDQKADPGSKMEIVDGVLYFADTVNGVIRAIDLDTGTIETIAGKYESAGTTTYVDAITTEEYEADAGSIIGYAGDGGPALDAVFNTPRDIAIGLDGEIYIADTKNSCVRVVRDGTIDTFAGQCGSPGFSGDEGPATDAQLAEPFGVAVDPEGNVYISDTLNHVIRKVVR